MEKPRLFPQRKSRKKYRIPTGGAVHGFVGKELGKEYANMQILCGKPLTVGKAKSLGLYANIMRKIVHGRESKELHTVVHGYAKNCNGYSFGKTE